MLCPTFIKDFGGFRDCDLHSDSQYYVLGKEKRYSKALKKDAYYVNLFSLIFIILFYCCYTANIINLKFSFFYVL